MSICVRNSQVFLRQVCDNFWDNAALICGKKSYCFLRDINEISHEKLLSISETDLRLSLKGITNDFQNPIVKISETNS